MRVRNLAIAVLCGVAVVAPSALQAQFTFQDQQWIETWSAAPEGTLDNVTLNNLTFRQVAHISAGGGMLRIRITNDFTNGQTVIGDVHIALSASTSGNASSAIVPNTDHVVTFGQKGTVTLTSNSSVLSDPIAFPVRPLSDLAVSIYVAQGTQPATLHPIGLQTAYSVTGDQASAASFPANALETQSRYLLSAIDVISEDNTGTIVTLAGC